MTKSTPVKGGETAKKPPTSKAKASRRQPAADALVEHALGATAPRRSRPHLVPTVAEREEQGRAARLRTPRRSHAGWVTPSGRPDPIVTLEAQNTDRLPDLVPIRHGRMLASPFAFFRGAAAVMAWDLAHAATTDLGTQLCGDAHVSNFGLFGAPDRTIVFDVNDFDETLPGSFEWDLKRLAASAVIAAQVNGFTAEQQRAAAMAATTSYHSEIVRLVPLGELDTWYQRIDERLLLRLVDRPIEAKRVEKNIDKARRRTSLQAFSKLATHSKDGSVYIDSQWPLVVELKDQLIRGGILQIFHSYKQTLSADRRALLDTYEFRDVAHKVVGVGSVGTRCLILLFTGRDDSDPLFLQAKQATWSVLAPFFGESQYDNHGRRVVEGQRLMQNASDIFLGWARGPAGRDFYFRQLRDMKGSADTSMLTAEELAWYAGLCGGTLALAHARGGDRIPIATYLGSSERFADAIAEFAMAYAAQNEADYEAFKAAVAAGRLKAEEGY